MNEALITSLSYLQLFGTASFCTDGTETLYHEQLHHSGSRTNFETMVDERSDELFGRKKRSFREVVINGLIRVFPDVWINLR